MKQLINAHRYRGFITNNMNVLSITASVIAVLFSAFMVFIGYQVDRPETSIVFLLVGTLALDHLIKEVTECVK